VTTTPASRRVEPPIGPASEGFWEATRERRLVVQWCLDCDRPVFYPRERCPGCFGERLEWRPCRGTGTVYSFTVNHLSPDPAGGDGPFVVALVELAEGHRMMSNIVGPPEQVSVGMPVQVTWEPLPDGRHYPLFEPARAAP
jgi:uncharacterized OB-fold protein